MVNKATRVVNSALFDEFSKYFALSLAVSDEERAAVYGVRYSVYCEEFGYEPVQAFQDSQERDEYDARAIHCLVTHRETETPAGCVRLVLATPDQALPLESHCEGSLYPDAMASFEGERDRMCEISRLAVDGVFRRRHGEGATRFGACEHFSFHQREKRTFPLIAVALFIASSATADLLGRKHCFAIMEPFLPTILRRTGVNFQRIGDDFDFRGKRAAYYADMGRLIADAPDELRSCVYAVREQFEGPLSQLDVGLVASGSRLAA